MGSNNWDVSRQGTKNEGRRYQTMNSASLLTTRSLRKDSLSVTIDQDNDLNRKFVGEVAAKEDVVSNVNGV